MLLVVLGYRRKGQVSKGKGGGDTRAGTPLGTWIIS